MKQERIRVITIFIGIFLLAIPLDTVQVIEGVSVLRALAVIPIILSFFYKKEFKVKKDIVYLFIFVFYLLIQIFYSINASVTISKTITFAMYFILVFLCTSIEYNEKEKKYLERMFALSTIVTVILLLIFGIYEEGRLTFLIGSNKSEDENQLCGYLIAGIIYFLKNIMEKKNMAISSLFVFIFLFVALLTGSRGGLLAIILAIVVCLICFASNKKKMLKNIVYILLIGVILLFTLKHLLSFISPQISNRFSIQSVIETGGTGRTKIWKNYLDIYNEAPLINKIFGYGIGGITSSADKVAHNNWIELLVETGIVGVTVYLILILSLVKTAYQNKNIYLFSVLIGYIGLTMSLSLFSYKPIWGVMLLILLKCRKIENKDSKKEKLLNN